MTGLWGDGPYQAWTEFLRRWAAGDTVDPADLPDLRGKDYPPDTWARLGLHLGEALDARITNGLDGLTRALAFEHDEFAVGRALAQARHGLRSVRALAAHPGLPEETRRKLTELIDQQIRSLQAQLERNLDHLAAQRGVDAGFVERRRRTIRDNTFTALLDRDAEQESSTSPTLPVPADPWAGRPPGQRQRRRVISD